MKLNFRLMLAPLLLVLLFVVACRPTSVTYEPTQFRVVAVYDTIGNHYDLTVRRAVDTTFLYARITRDTLKDADGKVQTDAFNNPIVKRDTTWVPGTKTARFIQLDTILLQGDVETQVRIHVEGNANWVAPLPIYDAGRVNWFLTTSIAGGGDAIITANARRGLTTGRRTNNLAHQYIFTRDSLVLYHLIFNQEKRQ